MTQISFTSGELMDLIKLCDEKAEQHKDDAHLAAYYFNMGDQLSLVNDKLQDFIPENRVANLVLACN